MAGFGTRLIRLDDDNPSLIYEGDWEIDEELHDDLAHRPIGPQHRTTGIASMSFEFRGQQVALSGTIRALTNSTGGIVGLPSWRCTVDGNEITNSLPEGSFTSINLHQYCSTANTTLSAGSPHTFRIDVEATEETPLWIDLVFVRPTRAASTHSSFTNYTAILQHTDASLRFGPGWGETDNPTARWTATAGSQVDLQFIGPKLIWVGRFVHNNLSSSQSTGSYTLDGGPSIEFPIHGIRPGESDTGEFIVFQTPDLPRDRHNLSVIYHGFESPLVVDYLLVPDGDMFERDPRSLGIELDGRPAPITTAGVSPTGSPGAENSQSTPIGPIIGGVVGGVVLLIVVAVVAFFIHRRHKKPNTGNVPEVNLNPPPPPMSQFGAYIPNAGPYPPNQPAPTQVTYVTPLRNATSSTNMGYPNSPATYASGPHSNSTHSPDQLYSSVNPSYPLHPQHTYTSGTHSNSTHSPDQLSPAIDPFVGYSAGSPSVSSSSPTVPSSHSYGSKGQVHLNPTPVVAPTYHQDSGIRLSHAQSDLATSVPPAYTPN